MSLIKIENQTKHIKSECANIYGNDDKVDSALDSITDACGVIETDASEIITELEEKIKEQQDKIEELEDEIEEKEGVHSISFTPITEYEFESMAGKMSLCSSSLADDQLLGIFKELALNVKTSELTEAMQDLLDKYKPY